jgi:lysozyme
MKKRVTVGSLVVSAVALVSIASFEGYRGEAYKDVAGIPTIGYGETKGVAMGQTTTPERALIQLLKSVNSHSDQIRPLITVPLYQHEFDAYSSFAYNVGVSNFKN